MKKILAFILCAVLLCAVPIVVSAESTSDTSNEALESALRRAVKDQYIEGKIPREGALSLLVSHGGMDSDEANRVIEEWDSYIENIPTEDENGTVDEDLPTEEETGTEEDLPTEDENGTGEDLPTEGENSADTEDLPTEEDNGTEEDLPTEGENTPETEEKPTEDENATEDEISASESMTEQIVGWVKSHFEEISVIVSLLLMIFYEIRKHRKLNGSIGTLNNNAISISKGSVDSIDIMLKEAKDIAGVVRTYRDEFAGLLEEVRKSDEEKRYLEETLTHVETFLKAAKLATLELSNEVAELLVLANIPNSKKEELYARHIDAVHKLETVEGAVEGVINNDSEET
jgi:hypothetical protein